MQRVTVEPPGAIGLRRRLKAALGAVTGARASEPDLLPFAAADADADEETLRARMAAHGHLFFRGLLPSEVVLEARAEALALCREAGWIAAGASPLDARFSGGGPTPADADRDYLAFYARWIAAPAFNSLPEHPALLAVAAKLLGDDVLVHPRKIGRVGFPRNQGHQTPAHQDHFHIRGTTQTYTAWVPLGDVPRRLGCLAVADGTHRLGFREHEPSAGPGGFAVDAGAAARWCSQDFAVGDVVMFHSLTMHRALPNRTSDEIRVSLDNRYQQAGDAIDPGSLKPHI